jgi:hypothetical protein
MSEWQDISTAPKGTPVLCWIAGFMMVPNVMTQDDDGTWRESAVDGRVLSRPQNIIAWMHLPAPPREDGR